MIPQRLPYVLTGCAAALVQGAPVPAEAIEIAVPWSESARFTDWLTVAYGQRWNARWQRYGFLPLEPEEPGEHRWRTVVGEIRAMMCDELPESIDVWHGGRVYRMVPLARIEITDPHAAELLARYRRMAAEGTRPAPAGRSQPVADQPAARQPVAGGPSGG